MPLTRSPSAGNLMSLENVTDDEENEQHGTGPGRRTTFSHVITRQQARRDAAGNNLVTAEPQTLSGNRVSTEQHIVQIVEGSLENFRREISGFIGVELRKAMSSMSVNLGLPTDGVRRSTSSEHDTQQESQPFRTSSGTGVGITPISTDKTANLINNWHVTFEGTVGKVSVDDFIYRIRTLTTIHLRGDFNLLCQHAHILFEGKARQWFWRYHRQKEGMFDWLDLCEALKKQFRDISTDIEIKDDMRRRKQRNGENFEEYLEGIMKIGDRLQAPLTDQELVDIIIRNLRTDLRYELLHINIPNIAVLRSEVRKHERFNEELRTWPNRSNVVARKHISEVVLQTESVGVEDVEALRSSVINCWNCDAKGHLYHDCLAPRRIFCYGCGKVDTYKPNCSDCLYRSKSLNLKKDVYPMADSHPQKKPRK